MANEPYTTKKLLQVLGYDITKMREPDIREIKIEFETVVGTFEVTDVYTVPESDGYPSAVHVVIRIVDDKTLPRLPRRGQTVTQVDDCPECNGKGSDHRAFCSKFMR